MKLVKLTITAFLLLVATTLGGDLFQDYLRHFEYTFDYTSFSLPFKVNGDEMTTEILETADDFNIMFFTVRHETDGIAHEIVTIYYSDVSILEEIHQRCNIKTTEYSSILFGKTSIYALPFEKSSQELLTGEYYLVGDEQKMMPFKMALMDKYGGSLIRSGYDPMDDKIIVIAVWAAIVFVFLLLTLFEYSMALKGNAIEITMGRSPISILFRTVITDIVGLTIWQIILRTALPLFTNPSFLQSYAFIALVCMFAIDIIIYSKLFRLNAYEILRGNKKQRGLLASCYATKYIIGTLLITVVATNSAVIKEAIIYSTQGSFWEKYAQYNQLAIRYVSDDQSLYISENGEPSTIEMENLLINYKAYNTLFSATDVTLMSYVGGKDLVGGTDIIAYNKNLSDYLMEKMPDIDFSTLNEGRVYAFVPRRIFKTELTPLQVDNLNHIVNYFMDWDGNFTDGADIVFYDKTVKLLAVEGNMRFNSKYYKNPIVIFTNIDELLHPRINIGDNNIGSNNQFTMYNISKEVFENFAERENPDDYDVQIFHANIDDQYQYRWGVLRKTLFINTLLCILLICLNVLITIVTTRLNYSINAVELALKKIVGYTVFERQQKLLIGAIIGFLIGCTVAIIIGAMLDFNSVAYVIIVSLLFFAVDLAVIIKAINKTEKECIQKILKGGAL
jgi:hypothetical protein